MQPTITDNWAEVEYDAAVWIPVPVSFEGWPYPDAAEWAWHFALDRYTRTGQKISRRLWKREIGDLAERLVGIRSGLVGKLGAHKIFLHCPEPSAWPTAAGIALWRSDGGRDEALRRYALHGAEDATAEPVVEEFATDALGSGLKAVFDAPTPDHCDLCHTVNYAWHDETFKTDVRLFAIVLDRARFDSMLPDLDQLAHGIRCVPDQS